MKASSNRSFLLFLNNKLLKQWISRSTLYIFF
jgi:hypothetical protein